MVLPQTTNVAGQGCNVAPKSSNVGTSHHQRCTKKQQWWYIGPPTVLSSAATLHKKAAALVPHTTNGAQKSSNIATSHHQHCTKKQQRWCLRVASLLDGPASLLSGVAIVCLGGSTDFWSLMGTSRFPLFGVSLAGSRSTAGFAHPVVCCSLMETSGFPLSGVALAGSRPGGRPTFLRRQESRQRRRPRFTGRRLRRRPPCAARIERPAQNSPASRAQTAAPESPARCCAARRFRRGFQQTPSLY